jgi:iron-sulfur cluster assembly protein
MITVTSAAAEQIKISAEQGKSEGMSLRIAAERNDDNSIHYGMGFDDSKEDTTIDFVELEPEKFQFIFMNPNDSNYKAPEQ